MASRGAEVTVEPVLEIGGFAAFCQKSEIVLAAKKTGGLQLVRECW